MAKQIKIHRSGVTRSKLIAEIRIYVKDEKWGSNWEIPGAGMAVNSRIILGFINGISSNKQIINSIPANNWN